MKANKTSCPKRVATALAAAFLLAACQHMPDIDGLFSNPAPASRSQSHAPARKTTAQPATAALRGAQEGDATSESDPRDPNVRATALRAAALEQVNRGDINNAVANLQAARKLDPGNELVRRDLQRALRIQSTVSARGQ